MALSQFQDNGVFGQQTQETSGSDFNAILFVFTQLMNKIQTMTLVRVVAVTNAGGVSSVGFVDVEPLINQMSGDRQATPHGTIYNIPYFRLQGGTDAIILDPKIGDIGACGFCSRDISVVKETKAQANPGSFRTFDWADGLYFGGMLNGTPVQYVRFSATGIEVVSPMQIKMTAPTIDLNGVTIDAAGNVDGPVASTFTAPNLVGITNVTFGGISGIGHKHTGGNGTPTLTGGPQ